MKRKPLLILVLLILGTSLGYFFIPITSLFGLSLDTGALLGAIFWLIVGGVLAYGSIRRRQLKMLLWGLAIGGAFMGYGLWQQTYYGAVATYRGKVTSRRERVDWGVHPLVAFYAASWTAFALPAMIAYGLSFIERE